MKVTHVDLSVLIERTKKLQDDLKNHRFQLDDVKKLDERNRNYEHQPVQYYGPLS